MPATPVSLRLDDDIRSRLAAEAVLRMEGLILDNPFIGTTTHRPEVRRLRVARTPVFVLYRPTPAHIEVLRVIDSRSLDSMIEE